MTLPNTDDLNIASRGLPAEYDINIQTGPTSVDTGLLDIASRGLPATYIYKTATVVLQSLSGTLTTSGALAKVVSKVISGVLTSAGSIAVVVSKTISGSLPASGTLVRLVDKVLAGSLTSSGSLARQVNTAFTGVLGSGGSVIQGVVTTLAGTLSSVGSISYNVSKLVSGVLNNSGNVTKQASKSFDGTLTTQGDLTTQVVPATRFMDGTLTTSGQLSLLVIPGPPVVPSGGGGRVRYRMPRLPLRLPLFKKPERVIQEPVRKYIRANSHIDLSATSSLSATTRQRGIITSRLDAFDPISTVGVRTRQLSPEFRVGRIAFNETSTFESRTEGVLERLIIVSEKQASTISVLQKELAASRQNETLALLGVL